MQILPYLIPYDIIPIYFFFRENFRNKFKLLRNLTNLELLTDKE